MKSLNILGSCQSCQVTGIPGDIGLIMDVKGQQESPNISYKPDLNVNAAVAFARGLVSLFHWMWFDAVIYSSPGTK